MQGGYLPSGIIGAGSCWLELYYRWNVCASPAVDDLRLPSWDHWRLFICGQHYAPHGLVSNPEGVKTYVRMEVGWSCKWLTVFTLSLLLRVASHCWRNVYSLLSETLGHCCVIVMTFIEDC